MSPKRLIGFPEVMAKTGLRHTAIYERMRSGEFPASIKIGACARWLETDVDAWIDRQIVRRAHRGKV
jgi:prophage regulatory protein